MSEKDERKVTGGQRGGRSRSDAKKASSSANLAKARMKRWPGRELAKQSVEIARATNVIVSEQAQDDLALALANEAAENWNANRLNIEFSPELEDEDA
jgi:hypothetical protein